MAAADDPGRRAARRGCRCAPSPPANWSCRGRCLRRGAPCAAAGLGRARRSGAAPSVLDSGQRRLDVGADLGQETQPAQLVARLLERTLAIEMLGERGLEPGGFGPRFLEQFREPPRIALAFGFGERLAPRELVLQELGRQGGIGLAQRLDAVQRQQMLRAPHRILEGAVSLVDPRRGLQRQPPLGFPRGGEAIRVHPSLQGAISGIERVARRRVEAISPRQAEEREVVLREVDQTLKLSPQPHSSFTLGLLNLNPSFNPSRAKSSSVPSRYGMLLGSTTTVMPWLSKR